MIQYARLPIQLGLKPIYRGDTYVIALALADERSLVDFGGVTAARMQFKAAITDVAPIKELKLSDNSLKIAPPVVLAAPAALGAKTLSINALEAPFIANGAVLNFGGILATLTERAFEGATTLKIKSLSAVLSSGATAPTGCFVGLIPHTETSGIAQGVLTYDLEATWPTQRLTLWRGNVSVEGDVSRDP